MSPVSGPASASSRRRAPRPPANMLAFAVSATARLSAASRTLVGSSTCPSSSTTSLFLGRSLPSLRTPAVITPTRRAFSATAPAMTLGRCVVAGGTGFVGTRLVRALVDSGADVTVLTRARSSAGHLPAGVTAQVWAPDKLAAAGDDWVGWQKALEGADLVVNLCGEPVVARWNEAGRKGILESRLKSTTAIAEAIAGMEAAVRPKCVVSTSAVGYYGVSEDAEFDEGASPAKGDFLADVSVKWEAAAAPIADAGVRLAVFRLGVVVGVGGGALSRMLPFYKAFLGGPIGSGSQWMSWVHVDDVVGMIMKTGEDEGISGVYNATAPKPVTMAEFSASLARALGRPNLFPVPGIALKIALGEASSIVLQGQKVLPRRWETDGSYTFKYPDIDSAMDAVARES
jgi:uncharacterized protein